MEQLKGDSLLQEPTQTLAECFTVEQRDKLGIRGLVPTRVQTPELQEQRILALFDAETDSMKKFLMLSDLYDRNIHLYYFIVTRNFAKLAPYIYTPHVGAYCQHYHEVYRPKRCLYYSLEDADHIDDITAAWPMKKVEVVVVTDGGRILGLGDLGANGIGIPIGKLALYCAGAGSDPRTTLPVQIDVGTNNVALREHPLYMGLNKPRLGGQPYRDFVAKVVTSIHNRWPEALIQFEDFGIENAFVLLQEWREKLLSFNDDIQGTGAVATAVVINALRARGQTVKDLINERIVFLGAGSAGVGIANAIVDAMVQEGIKKEDAQKRIYLLGSKGLLGKDYPKVSPQQLPYQHNELQGCMPLLEVVKTVKPSIIIGVSGQSGAFTEEIVKTMASINERPIIMPLSNPTSKAECTLEQVAEWTDGRGLFASGSPFTDVTYKKSDGTEVLVKGNQCNNMYIFPALGLAAAKAKAKRVSEPMLSASCYALANLVSDEDVKKGILLPPLSNPHSFSLVIATDVVLEGLKQGDVSGDKLKELGCASLDKEGVSKWLSAQMYRPEEYFPK